MIKNKGCVIFLIIAAASLIGGLIIAGLVIFVMFVLVTGEATVSLPDNISPEQAKLQADPFYRNAGGWDYSRLALIKPYELFSCDRHLEDPGLMDNTNKGASLIGRQICGVKQFNVFKNYFIAYVESGIGQTGTIEDVDIVGNKYCYLILDLNKKGYPDFHISRDYAFGRLNYCGEKIIKNTNPPYVIVVSYGKNKKTEKFKNKKAFLDKARYFGFFVDYIIHNYNQIEISMPQKYQACVFFNEKDLKAGLKARGIPADIKLLEPKYFYQKFLDEGQCPWFPKQKKKPVKQIERNIKSKEISNTPE